MRAVSCPLSILLLSVLAGACSDPTETDPPARLLIETEAELRTGDWRQLSARAGTDARHAALSLEGQSAIHDQVIAERESVSGVNLDEEAADMMRFQQAYQAAAQVIAFPADQGVAAGLKFDIHVVAVAGAGEPAPTHVLRKGGKVHISPDAVGIPGG